MRAAKGRTIGIRKWRCVDGKSAVRVLPTGCASACWVVLLCDAFADLVVGARSTRGYRRRVSFCCGHIFVLRLVCYPGGWWKTAVGFYRRCCSGSRGNSQIYLKGLLLRLRPSHLPPRFLWTNSPCSRDVLFGAGGHVRGQLKLVATRCVLKRAVVRALAQLPKLFQ